MADRPAPGEAWVLLDRGLFHPRIDCTSPDGRYRVLVDLVVYGQRLSIGRVEVTPWVFGEVVEPDALRRLPLGRWLRQAHATLSDEALLRETGELGKTPEGREVAARVAQTNRAVPPRPRGRPSKGDEFYREVALKCLELQNQGVTTGMHERIAQELAKVYPGIGREPGTVRDWLHRATVLGFLMKGSPGRPGQREAGARLGTQQEGS
jgi:hypothetical protein